MRKGIWEQSNYQCSIIGACLSPAELKALAGQLGLALDPKAGGFHLHEAFVSLCMRDCPEAKAITRALNKKYARTLRRFARAKDEAGLRGLWQEARQQGEIAGPYWALLSHPRASEGLRREAFGDVHMLSHSRLADSQAEAKRLHRLERGLEKMSEKYAKARAHYRARIRDLTRQNRAGQKTIWTLAKDLEGLRNRAKETGDTALRAENNALQRSLAVQSLGMIELKSAKKALEQRLGAYEKQMRHLQEELGAKDLETRFLEGELARPALPPDCDNCEKAGTSECPGPLLCGKRILYVGGRVNLVRHYRDLVERHGGRFRHHDGGIENSQNLLPKLVSAADAVVCPLDCVSHNACLYVKESCKNEVKTLKLLKTSGLSSLAECLKELGAQPEPRRAR
ncbi:MAG: DUF2325 domain-containing protein [Desulfovibrionaceae bacterium]|nr:DUF2325 domain-containing protein [Desulfovibrionaceae bacterium]